MEDVGEEMTAAPVCEDVEAVPVRYFIKFALLSLVIKSPERHIQCRVQSRIPCYRYGSVCHIVPYYVYRVVNVNVSRDDVSAVQIAVGFSPLIVEEVNP